MPKTAGSKLSTPLIREFARYLIEDVERAPKTVDGYRDNVEFFAALHPSASTLTTERVPSAVSAPNECKLRTDDELPWADVSLEDVERFCRMPLVGTEKVPSQSTRRKRVYALKGFFEFLADHEVIDRDPTRKLRGPGVKIGKPKPIPDDVWLLTWDQDMSIDDRVLLGLGYYAGLRRHELIGIGPHHFDLFDRRLLGFQRKGGAENVVMYGGNNDLVRERLPHLAVRLDEFENDLERLCFARRHEERLIALTEHVGIHEPDSSINRRLTALSQRCRVHITPHMLRHSFATNLLRMGVPELVVADQLCHANLQTTRNYADATAWYGTLAPGSAKRGTDE